MGHGCGCVTSLKWKEIHGDMKENQNDMSSIRKNKQIKAQLILLKTSPCVLETPWLWNRCCCRRDRLWKMNHHFPLSSHPLCSNRNYRALSARRMQKKRERKSLAEYLNMPDKETVQMRQEFESKSQVSYNKYVNATVCKSTVLWIESLIRKKIIIEIFYDTLDNLLAFSTWFHSHNSSPSFHLTCSLIKEMPYKITFLKVSPTSGPYWGILFVWIVNIDIWIRLGRTVLLNQCMRGSPCVWRHTPMQQPTHTELWE